MSVRNEKHLTAAENSIAHLSKSREYTGVDGRTYQTEPPLPSTTPNLSQLYKSFGKGFPSLLEVYRCDYYLSKNARYYKGHVTPKEKERLINELALVFDPKMRRYTASAEGVWEYFKEKYPQRIEQLKITSYGELVYRSMYR